MDAAVGQAVIRDNPVVAAVGGNLQLVVLPLLPGQVQPLVRAVHQHAYGEVRTILPGFLRLRKFQADLSQMLDNFTLDEFKAADEAGNTVLGSQLTKGKAVLIFTIISPLPTL